LWDPLAEESAELNRNWVFIERGFT
jgi:hypothetical protein